MMMEYDNNYFVGQMYWLYVKYGQITPGYLMINQDKIQATYNIEVPI